jgi:hypothetical protein
MARPRSQYRYLIEGSQPPAAPHVLSTPVEARFTPAASTQAPPQEPSNPVDDAANNAIQERLAEQQRAEGLRSQQSRQPPFADEPPQPDPIEATIAHVPERAKAWLRGHKDFLLDARKRSAATCALADSG